MPWQKSAMNPIECRKSAPGCGKTARRRRGRRFDTGQHVVGQTAEFAQLLGASTDSTTQS
jgi:hypothetical protein